MWNIKIFSLFLRKLYMIRCSKKSLTDIPKEWMKSQIKDVTLLMKAGGNLGLTKIKDYQIYQR